MVTSDLIEACMREKIWCVVSLSAQPYEPFTAIRRDFSSVFRTPYNILVLKG